VRFLRNFFLLILLVSSFALAAEQESVTLATGEIVGIGEIEGRPLRLLKTESYADARPRPEDASSVIAGLERPLTQNWVERYSRPAGLRWLEGVLARGEPYMAFIRAEIEERGLPPELLYLPVIESEYRITAKSRTGAAGFWQFMENSIKPYMRITEWVDERYDFYKSTRGALSKLADNYAIYGDWALAIAGYNCGNTALRKAIKTAGSSDYWTLAENGKLKKDTIQYVPKLLAIYHIASNPRKFGLRRGWEGVENEWVTIQVDTQVDLSLLSSLAGLPPETLLSANRAYKWGVTPPEGGAINVSAKNAPALREALEKSAHAGTALITKRYHVVKAGETLWGISRAYGTTVNAILALNEGLRPEALRPGARLSIPYLPR